MLIALRVTTESGDGYIVFEMGKWGETPRRVGQIRGNETSLKTAFPTGLRSENQALVILPFSAALVTKWEWL